MNSISNKSTTPASFRFIKRAFLFLLPIILTNIIIINEGFVFVEKDVTLVRTIISKSKADHTTCITFFGTSRTNLGIAPDYVNSAFKEIGISSDSRNCGLDGCGPTTTLNYYLKNNFHHCDIFVIELYPGLDPMADTNRVNLNTPFSQSSEQSLIRILNRISSIQHLDRIFAFYRERSPVRSIFCHPNGWTEFNFDTNKTSIARAKSKWDNFSYEQQNADSAFVSYNKFASLIQAVVDNNNGANLVFLRMPVNGMLLEKDNNARCIFDPFAFLGKRFPYALYIDATENPDLNKFVTAENSHLNGKDAQGFSTALGKIIAEWHLNNLRSIKYHKTTNI